MAYTVRLRTRRFTASATLAGYRSDYALTRAMQVNRSTVTRMITGELHPTSS